MEPTEFLSGIYKGPLQINTVNTLIKKKKGTRELNKHFTKEIIQYMQCKTYTEIFKAVLRSQELEQPRCSSVVE